MAQYREGLVSVTQGSPVVTGTGTAWTGAVIPGQVFSLYRSGVSYTIASVDSGTRLTLSHPYAGASAAGEAYTITRDVTPYFNFPYPDAGDTDTTSLWKEMVLKVEGAIIAQDTGLTVVESRAASTPPATPSERGNYIVPANATGAWAGQAGRIAVWDKTTWTFIQPQVGWRVSVRDESYADVIYDAGGWRVSVAVGTLDRARDWAEKTDGPVEDTRYSAKHHAMAAGTLAQSAAQAAGTAQSVSEAAYGLTLASKSLTEAAAGAAAQYQTAAESARDAAVAARAAAQAAQTSATLARQGAETARDRAGAWASQESGPVEGGVYSARFYATQASGAVASVEAQKAAAEAAAVTASLKAGEASTQAKQAAINAVAAGMRAAETASSAASITQAAIDALAARTDAVNARDLAQAFAQAGRNTPVKPGLYSAYHWAEEARVQAETVVLTANAATTTATTTAVTTAVAQVTGDAPPVLDTLGKLAAAIGNDPVFITTLADKFGKKADRASLSAVALSGDYRDLTHQPVLPFVLANGTSSPIALTPGAL
ncbi:hypothetical protein M2352_004176 [Azospirillum fermentarium]|uniref:DUF2793 domain-containing protein n=1 Tax=Azospirillum fermentarium TaxID=1233114 RepID=UPI002226AF24|nr:DUF2793 domain-containing protein [Azospirillum fermentarium]MCW2248516.1 hypothetical protein [Azospirillum fermentarium]